MIATRQRRKHEKGQSDHVDAWLMSYADLITLLFMLFVIFVSVTLSKHGKQPGTPDGQPAHPIVKEHSGALNLQTAYEEAYRALIGIVSAANADQTIAVEKTGSGLWIDISAVEFFTHGTADIPAEQLPLLQSIAHALGNEKLKAYTIEVAGYTDDEKLVGSPYANNWELSAMRATRVVNLLTGDGIEPARLRAAGYAANRPVVENRDVLGNPIEKNRLRNQRVVIRLEMPSESLKVSAGS